MKILFGCEESQTVTIAFRKAGHEAYSNDLKPCSGGHPEWHLQMDVFEAIKLLKEYDVDKTQAEIDEYVARGFTMSIKDLKPKSTTQKREFVKNIRRGPLGRGSNVAKKESGFNPLNPFGSEN